MNKNQIPGTRNLERKMKKNASLDLQEYKIKGFRGDALLRFLAIEIFNKKMSSVSPFYKYRTVPDEFLGNYLLIQLAEDVLHLTPHPEEVAYFERIAKEILEQTGKVKIFKKPFANAFEVHLCEIFEAEGFEAAYDFVEKYVFSDFAIERIKRIKPDIFAEHV